MDFLKQWTICICITLVVAVILSLFNPGSSTGRFYKMLISIFIFLSFVYPFSNFDISQFQINSGISEMNVYDANNTMAQNLIKNNIVNLLSANNVDGSVVDVYSNADNEEIFINKIVVTVPDEYDTEQVKKIIFNYLSLNVEVVHIGQ